MVIIYNMNFYKSMRQLTQKKNEQRSWTSNMKKSKWPFNTRKDAHHTENYTIQIKKSDTISFIKMGKTVNSVIGIADEDMEQWELWYPTVSELVFHLEEQ